MELRNLAWHRKEIARIVSFKTEPDADFAGPTNAPYETIDAAFNQAQVHERNLAILESSAAFEKTVRVTWTANQATMTMPSYIGRESIVSLTDVTNNSSGIPITVARRAAQRKIWWLDNRTLQWMTTGPGSDTTVEITYIAEPQALTEPNQEADVFPYSHRHLLNWSAACILVEMADQRVPDNWVRRTQEYRSNFLLAISRGSPSETNVPRIRNHRAWR